MYPSLATINVCGFPLDYVAPLFTPPALPVLAEEPLDTVLPTLSIDTLAYLYAEADDAVANGDDDRAWELFVINQEMARRKRMRDIVATLRTAYAIDAQATRRKAIAATWHRNDPFND